MNKGVLIGIGILAAVLVVAYFAVGGGVYKAPKKQPVPTPAAQEETPPAPPTTGGEVREIMVSGNEYKFSPATINFTKGETVKITFKNMGKLPHNLAITELGVTTATIAGGAEDSVTVTADKTGMYTFFCSVGNHRQLGMEGKVEVK